VYHVALELTQEQVKQLKLRATNCDCSVKEHIRLLVVKDLRVEKIKQEVKEK